MKKFIFLYVFFMTTLIFSVTSKELADINSIQTSLISKILADGESISAKVSIDSAKSVYNMNVYSILSDTITSTRNYTASELSACKDLKDIDNVILVLAYDWYQNKSNPSVENLSNRDKAINMLWWISLLDLQPNEIKTSRYYVDPVSNEKKIRSFSSYIYYTKNLRKSIILLWDQLPVLKESSIGAFIKHDVMLNQLFLSKEDAYYFFYNTDQIYNFSEGLVGTIIFGMENDSVTVAYANGLKKYMEFFTETTSNNIDGFKPDGLGFHHGIHYNAYMYAYKVFVEQIYHLKGTNFQIQSSSYLFLRDALYGLTLVYNTFNELPSLGGRHPLLLNLPMDSKSYRQLAELGGEILGVAYDPKIAGFYNRLWSSNPIAGIVAENFPTGFWQFNYGPLAIYRQDNWLAGMNGFNRSFKGGEISPQSGGSNMYGRYQNYGTLEVLYSGGRATSGFNINGWDWNKWPATTTLQLPWDKLIAGSKDCSWGLNEFTDAKFCGALRFKKVDNGLLNIEGELGLFAMDFRQKMIEDTYLNVCGTPFIDTHDTTFIFKKSVIVNKNKLLLLGSNICHNDANYPVITTMFQGHLVNSSDAIYVNGNSITALPYNQTIDDAQGQWFIDASGTGYLMYSNSKVIISRKNQESPSREGDGTFTYNNYACVWIDHGNAPTNASYAYAVIPNATVSGMNLLASQSNNGLLEDYSILQQNNEAHILSYKDSLFSYVLFSAQDSIIYGDVISNDKPVLVMTERSANNLNLTLVNPDLGFNYSFSGDPSFIDSEIPVTLSIKGNWFVVTKHSDISLVSANENQTTFLFQTKHGLPMDLSLSLLTAKNESSFKNLENSKFALEIFPNPFNPSTTINFVNSKKSADIFIYGVNGKLVDSYKNLKGNSITWNASKFVSGSYLIKIVVGAKVFFKRIILLK